MPEVVEVHKYADMIKKHTRGHILKNIEILNGRYKKHGVFEGFNDLFKMKDEIIVNDVAAKGKLIYITFQKKDKEHDKDNEFIYLISTLGLSGGWTFSSDEYDNTIEKQDETTLTKTIKRYDIPQVIEFIGAPTQKAWKIKMLRHLNVCFTFPHGNLYFFDMLSFGTLKLLKTQEQLDKKLNEIGADILDDTTTAEIFIERLRKKTLEHKLIGNVVVNQKIISGVGNYLRADGLWMSKISPHHTVSSLSDEDLTTIYKSFRRLVVGDYNYDHAIHLGLITKSIKIPRDYKRDFFVYRQSTDIDGNPVKTEEMYEGSQKRTIFWCPAVQK